MFISNLHPILVAVTVIGLMAMGRERDREREREREEVGKARESEGVKGQQRL